MDEVFKFLLAHDALMLLKGWAVISVIVVYLRLVEIYSDVLVFASGIAITTFGEKGWFTRDVLGGGNSHIVAYKYFARGFLLFCWPNSR